MCILLYADDIALFANNENDLQHLICRVATWCNKNRLAMNVNKTKVLHIRPKRRARSSFPFACNSIIIDYCNEYKYLGIWFNEYLDCKQTLEHTARSARKALAGVCVCSKEFGGFLYQTYTLLYKSLVTPILDYSACIWGYQEHPQLTIVQNNAMCFFLGCNKSMPLVALTGEIGWLPTHYRQMNIILKLFIQLESNTCNPYYRVYSNNLLT